MKHIVALSLGFALAVSSVSGAGATNLIFNPGNDLPLVAGGIQGWTEVLGNNWTKRSISPPPQAGESYFFAGVGPSAELSQTVDVSGYSASILGGMQRFSFTGFVRSYPQARNDTSQIILEYLNSDLGIVDSFQSLIFSDASQWTEVFDERLAPTDTAFVRVRLLSTRRTGANNDGYFDSLSLTPSEAMTTVPEPTAWAMFFGGFGTVGALMRKRRRTSHGQRTVPAS